MAIADEAVLNYLTERFGQQDDAVGNWPRDWHECPEAIELWKKTIRDIWLSRSIDNLTSAQKEIETDRKKITPSIAASNNHNSILEKRQELIEGITPDLFDWETPFSKKQINEYYNHKQTFLKEHPVPVEIVNYCAGECPMFILAIPGTVKTASRGYPLRFVPKDLEAMIPSFDIVQTLRSFCKKYELKYQGPPSWFLSSYWG